MKHITTLVAIALVAAITSVQASGKSAAAAAAKPGTETIVEIVLANDGEFDVLEAAVIHAGLVGLLNGTDQYTVFAPTDAAFVSTLGVADEAAAIAYIESLPAGAVAEILAYHVIGGRRISTSVVAASEYVTIGGAILTRDELLAAGIFAVDRSASNGVIHIINAVLLPPAP